MGELAGLPARRDGVVYLTEGGIETEIMYKWGYELPEFAMFPLLENPEAVAAMQGMYRRYLDVAADEGLAAFMSGLDYRASPDWGRKLGYSEAGLAEANTAAIDFLKNLRREYAGDISDIRIGGVVGPRGDAYALNRTITVDEAEDYHAVQLATLKAAGVDIVGAATFNNIPEAVGLARAAQALDVPLTISLTVTETGWLRSGPSVAEAVTAIDAQTGGSVAFFGLNCSHPVEFMPGLEAGDWAKRMRSFRPNASKMEKIALCKLGHLEEGDPDELGVLMGELAGTYPHMDVWGGCCGTGDLHLRQIARAVKVARGLTR